MGAGKFSKLQLGNHNPGEGSRLVFDNLFLAAVIKCVLLMKLNIIIVSTLNGHVQGSELNPMRSI